MICVQKTIIEQSVMKPSIAQFSANMTRKYDFTTITPLVNTEI